MFVIIGWIVALSAVFGVFIAHGGNIAVVLHALPFEMAAIGGAALGAFIANNQPKVLKATMKGLGQCFKGSKYTKARYMELMALMYDILQKARKEGLMSIEKDVEEPHNSPLFQKYPAVGSDHHVAEFITDYLRMMVSGNLNAHEIESLMDNEIETHHHEAHSAVAALQRLAGALPAFGIVAAVLGVVNTMGSVGQPPAVLEQYADGADAADFAEQREALQEAVWMAENQLRAYSPDSMVRQLDETSIAQVNNFAISAIATITGAFVAVAALATPGALAASAAATLAFVVAAPVVVIGGAASVMYWRRANTRVRMEFDAKVDTVKATYLDALETLTRKEKERLRQYGQQVVAPIFSKLEVLASRYSAQRTDLEHIAEQIAVLRRAIGE